MARLKVLIDMVEHMRTTQIPRSYRVAASKLAARVGIVRPGMAKGHLRVQEADPVHLPVVIGLESHRSPVIHFMLGWCKHHQVGRIIHAAVTGVVPHLLRPGWEEELHQLVEWGITAIGMLPYGVRDNVGNFRVHITPALYRSRHSGACGLKLRHARPAVSPDGKSRDGRVSFPVRRTSSQIRWCAPCHESHEAGKRRHSADRQWH
jgi:hypothetical protein